MHNKTISVARDFSPYPGPRYIVQGPYSGEKFRPLLSRALREHDSVTVDLDGTTGFGSSFLDEVFGGLVRNEGFRLDDLQKRLHIISVLDASYKVEAWESIREAEQFVAASKRPA